MGVCVWGGGAHSALIPRQPHPTPPLSLSLSLSLSTVYEVVLSIILYQDFNKKSKNICLLIYFSSCVVTLLVMALTNTRETHRQTARHRELE